MEQNYIKARPQLAKALGVDGIRNKFPDGNYLLYWADPHKNWGWGDYAKMLEETGSRVITPAEAREEMDGGVSSPLPQPTDIRWKGEDAAGEEEKPELPEESGNDLAQGPGNGTSTGNETGTGEMTTEETEPMEGDEG